MYVHYTPAHRHVKFLVTQNFTPTTNESILIDLGLVKGQLLDNSNPRRTCAASSCFATVCVCLYIGILSALKLLTFYKLFSLIRKYGSTFYIGIAMVI